MVFSSLIFLWLFLPITFIFYFVIKDKYQNFFLLLVSLFFYAWGEPRYILLLICSIAINWIIGLMIEKYYNKRSLLLVIGIILNIGILGYFKYFNFLIDIWNKIAGDTIEATEIVLPIGISFFTFQILSYIIDLYRGQYRAQRNILDLALYISFFPQLIAGPIVKYRDINEQLVERKITEEKIAAGIRRFIYGLGKKVILSNIIAQCVDTIYGLEYMQLTGVLAWSSAILYTLQIYYDFSGYSDMAIGMGKMFGFDFQENFRYPYLSCSIWEFWQRWHISLGTWFKEYVYIPLGGNRKGIARTYLNLIIVFFLTGLWHGANFTFILWGIYHGIFQIIERMGFKRFLDRHKVLAHLYTCIVVVFGWVLFRADNLVQAGVMIKRMLIPWQYTETTLMMGKVFENKTIFIIIVGLLGCGLMQDLFSRYKFTQKWKNSFAEMVFCCAVFIVCISMLASNTYNPFIYFRF